MLGLAGGHIPTAEFPAFDPSRLRMLIDYHRIGPWILRQISDKPSLAAGLPASLIEDLRRACRQNLLHALAQRSELDRIARALGDAGITMAVFKGVVLEDWLYGKPGNRDVRDIDILVDIGEVRKAGDLLESLGYVRRSPSAPLEGASAWLFRRLFAHETYDQTERGTHVELHWRLFRNAAYLPTGFEAELDGRIPFDVGTRTVTETLGPLAHTLLVAVHAANHGWARLKWLVDVHLAAQRLSERDHGKILHAATALGLRTPYLASLRASEMQLGTSLPESVKTRDAAVEDVAAYASDVLSRSWLGEENVAVQGLRQQIGFRLRLRSNARYRAEVLLAPLVEPNLLSSLPAWQWPAYPFLRLARWLQRPAH